MPQLALRSQGLDNHLIHDEEGVGECICDFQVPLWRIQRCFPSPCSLTEDFYFQK